MGKRNKCSLFHSVTSSSSGVSSVSGGNTGVSTRSVKSYETAAAVIIKKTKATASPKPSPKKAAKEEPKVR